jgi:hypothetical protein
MWHQVYTQKLYTLCHHLVYTRHTNTYHVCKVTKVCHRLVCGPIVHTTPPPQMYHTLTSPSTTHTHAQFPIMSCLSSLSPTPNPTQTPHTLTWCWHEWCRQDRHHLMGIDVFVMLLVQVQHLEHDMTSFASPSRSNSRAPQVEPGTFCVVVYLTRATWAIWVHLTRLPLALVVVYTNIRNVSLTNHWHL